MDAIGIIQILVFYLVILGFLGYGLWKAWEYYKKKKKENSKKSFDETGPGKESLKNTRHFQTPSPAFCFKSTDDLRNERRI